MLYVAHRGSWRAGGYNYSVTPLNVTAANGGNLLSAEEGFQSQWGDRPPEKFLGHASP